MTLRKKAVQGVVWSGIQNWGANLSSVAVFLVLTRLLAASDFGLIAWANVFIAVLTVLHRQGLLQAIVQRAELLRGHLDTAFWVSIAGGLLLGAGLLAGSGAIALGVGEKALGPVLAGLSVVLLTDSLGNVPRALLRRNMAFKRIAVRSLAAAAIGGVVGIGMAWRGFGVWSLVGQRVTTSVVENTLFWMAVSWRPGFDLSRKYFGDMFGYGRFAMGREVLDVIDIRTDDFLIATVLGTTQAGYYSVGRRLYLILHQMITLTISAVALPTFSRMQQDHAGLRQALLSATRMVSLGALPAFVGMSVLAPDLVHGLFGEKWDASVPIMQILALAGIVRGAAFFNVPMIMACGKPSWALAVALGRSVITLSAFLMVLLVLRWGIVAVALAYVARDILLAPIPILLVRRLIGLQVGVYLRQYIAPATAALVMAAAVWGVRQLLVEAVNTYLLLGACVLVGAAVYTLAVRLLAPSYLSQALDFVRLALSPDDRAKPA